MTSWSRTERTLLCDLFLEVGPEAPTLNEGWVTEDLAAHLVVRERRPDAAGGIFVPVLRGYQKHVINGYRTKPWGTLVQLVRSGPPPWLPIALPVIEQVVNTTEFFVHHEDVRRARPGWEPRTLDPRFQNDLWDAVTSRGMLLYRKAPVGITLRRDDGRERVVKPGASMVTLTGEPAELILHAFGRGKHAEVSMEGEDGALTRLEAAPLGV